MKKFKKALSLLLAGVAAATAMLCGSVSASAASSKTALLKTVITQVDSKATSITSLGQDLYMFRDDNYRAVYRIGSDEIKNWRSTGKLKATKITVDSKISKNKWYRYTTSSFDDGNYAVLGYTGSDSKTRYCIVKYDKSKNKITQIYSTTNSGVGVSSDGTISEFEYSSKDSIFTLKIMNSSAKVIKTLTYKISENKASLYGIPFIYGQDHALVSFYNEDENGFYEGTNILIDKNGKEKNISGLRWGGSVNGITYGLNYYGLRCRPSPFFDAYSIDKEKMYLFDSVAMFEEGDANKDDYKAYFLIDLGEKIYGTKAVGTYRCIDYSDPDNPKYEYKYALVNVSSDKFLSAKYENMSTQDEGKTFLVKNSKGQWGFLDSNGKKLSMFDDAGGFNGSGKYAPVIKSGKIYLVDKNMKRISKTINADKDSSVRTLGDELFLYKYGGKTYLMTNKK